MQDGWCLASALLRLLRHRLVRLMGAVIQDTFKESHRCNHGECSEAEKFLFDQEPDPDREHPVYDQAVEELFGLVPVDEVFRDPQQRHVGKELPYDALLPRIHELVIIGIRGSKLRREPEVSKTHLVADGYGKPGEHDANLNGDHERSELLDDQAGRRIGHEIPLE